MNKEILTTSDYTSFFLVIKNEILKSQKSVIQTINTQLVELYFEIGKIISKKIENSDWGKSFVESLSKDLKNEFPGIKGFSKQKVFNIVNFYKYYDGRKKYKF